MRAALTLLFISFIFSCISFSANANQKAGANRLSSINAESKIEGKWLGKISGPQGEFELTFTFKVEGDSLKGSSASSMGEIELTNGVVNGNSFSFDVDVQGMTITHKCTYLSDDTIEDKVTVNDQEMVMKLTRAAQ